MKEELTAAHRGGLYIEFSAVVRQVGFGNLQRKLSSEARPLAHWTRA
ncbi:MAG: hypothetical protein ACI814_003398 [Mariniblastus sp.]|jgi:hypothetical protein